MKNIIITICRDNLSELVQTCNSVSRFKNLEHYIFDGSKKDDIKLYFESTKHSCKYIRQRDSSIYDALNKSIAYVCKSLNDVKYRFLLLHAGDFLNYDISLINSKHDLIFGAYNIVFKEKKITKHPRYTDFEMPTSHQAFIYSSNINIKHLMYSLNYNICSDYDNYMRLNRLGYSMLINNNIFVDFTVGGTSTVNHSVLIKESMQIYSKYNKNIFKYYYRYVSLFLKCKVKYMIHKYV